MKENTYIIPAIDFYIGEVSDGMGLLPDTFIPFEKVDGMSVQELVDSLELDDFFAFYAASASTFRGYRNVMDKTIISVEKLLWATNGNKTIDKVIEEIYESRYQDASKREQEIFNNFFERYQDKNHEETKQRVKRLLGENKK